MPLREGAITSDHIIAEIGELLLDGGMRLGRRGSEDITLFKSLGLAVEDLAAAHHIYQKAAANGDGHWIVLGGTHEDAHAELRA
jgi:ornithine cyclodeaminase